MTSASALADTVSLLLFQNIMEGIDTGRIANVNTAQTEVKAAIAELNRRRLPEGPTHINDLVGYVVLLVIPPHQLMSFPQKNAPGNRVTPRESRKVRVAAFRVSIPGGGSQGRDHSDCRTRGGV